LGTSFRQSLNFTRVLEHEIGHTIGLGHTTVGGSTNNPNIMFASCCSSGTPIPPALGPDDLDGVNTLYPVGGAPPPPTCTYSISPTNASYPTAGGTGTVSVTPSASTCSWSAAVSTATFASITGGASGTGNGTVSYSVQANSGAARSGTLTIAGQTFTISQSALVCTFSLTPTSAAPRAAGA